MKANVYVEMASTFYCNALRRRFQDCKWLDVRALAETLFPTMRLGVSCTSPPGAIALTGRSPRRPRGSRCTSACWQPGMSRSSSASSVAARPGAASPSRALAALTVPSARQASSFHRGEGLRCQPRLAPTDRCLPRRLRDGDRAHQLQHRSSARFPWRALTSDSTSRCSAPATVPHGAFVGAVDVCLKKLRHGPPRASPPPDLLRDSRGEISMPPAVGTNLNAEALKPGLAPRC